MFDPTPAWLDPGPQMISLVTHLSPLFSSPRALFLSILSPYVVMMASCIANPVKRGLSFLSIHP